MVNIIAKPGEGVNTGFKTKKYYKYVPYDATNVIIRRTRENVTKESIKRDEAFNIMLGGPFEVVGGKEDIIGGGDQKVG